MSILTSDFMLVDIKAGLSNLLEVNPTQKAAYIKVLDGWDYPEFRLVSCNKKAYDKNLSPYASFYCKTNFSFVLILESI